MQNLHKMAQMRAGKQAQQPQHGPMQRARRRRPGGARNAAKRSPTARRRSGSSYLEAQHDANSQNVPKSRIQTNLGA